jgi:hypothetical protein
MSLERVNKWWLLDVDYNIWDYYDDHEDDNDNLFKRNKENKQEIKKGSEQRSKMQKEK